MNKGIVSNSSDEKYAIVVVFSNWTLEQIFSFLEDFLKTEKGEIGSARIEKYRTKDGEWRESNRTILLVQNSILKAAINNGLDQTQPNLDFRMCEYKLTDKHFPKEGQKSNIYLNFPKDIPHTDIDVQLRNRLSTMKKFGLIKHDYNIVIPLESRETGEHKGIGYINFTKDNLTCRSSVKLLLNDSRLYNDKDPNNYYYLKAFWVK